MPVEALAQVVQGLPSFSDPNLIIGAEGFSDAGVYRIDDDTAIVQSVDFFPPLVDDPFVFGQIAAANSFGDVYAMGGRPITAMNVVGFPDDKLDLNVLAEILRGGAERVLQAGAVVVGGHSVRDTEIKFGLSVTGVVNPKQMLTNQNARPGDRLVLTKGLGTGFITTANRAGRCPEDVMQAACDSMSSLNDVASRAAVEHGARAATDITGFGLAGHTLEMARASSVTIELRLHDLPLLPGVEPLLIRKNYTRANATNHAYAAPSMQIDVRPDDPRAECLFDPQTSGGLLIAVSADRADELVSSCRAQGLDQTVVIGQVVDQTDSELVISE